MVICGAAELAARSKELADMTAERNKCRSEAAAAERSADKIKQQLDALPQVPRQLCQIILIPKKLSKQRSCKT